MLDRETSLTRRWLDHHKQHIHLFGVAQGNDLVGGIVGAIPFSILFGLLIQFIK